MSKELLSLTFLTSNAEQTDLYQRCDLLWNVTSLCPDLRRVLPCTQRFIRALQILQRFCTLLLRKGGTGFVVALPGGLKGLICCLQ